MEEELIEINLDPFLTRNDLDNDPSNSNYFYDCEGYEEQLIDESLIDLDPSEETEIVLDGNEVFGILPTPDAEAVPYGVTTSTWYQCPSCEILLDNSLTFLEHKAKHGGSDTDTQITRNLNRDIQSELDQSSVEIVTPIILISRIEDEVPSIWDFLDNFGTMNSTHGFTLIIPNPELTCSICNQRMSTKDSLRRHMMRHTGEKPYGCHICDYRSIQKTHLKAHIFYNHGENELKTVSLTPALVPSVRKKLKKKELERMQDKRFPYGPYRCERCNVGFRKNDNLQRHNQKRHSNESSLPFPHGASTVATILQPPSFVQQLQQPLPQKPKARKLNPNPQVNPQVNPRVNPPGNLEVQNQGQQPTTSSFLFDNQNLLAPSRVSALTFNHEPVSLLAYLRCPVCSKLVSSDNRLRKHLLTHSGIRPYPCFTCGKIFKQKYHLKRHVIRVHKPAGMAEVPAKVNYSSYLNSALHKEREASASCSVCSRVLSNGDTLRRHMLIHQGIKPFACELCGETFRQKHHVQVHVKRHHKSDTNHLTPEGVTVRSSGTDAMGSTGVNRIFNVNPGPKPPETQSLILDQIFGF